MTERPTTTTAADHCGFKFIGGAKCYVDQGHPIHHNKWEEVHAHESDHAYRPEAHDWSLPTCRGCEARQFVSAPSAVDVDTLKWAIHYARKSNDAPEFDVAVAREMAERIIEQLRLMPTMDARAEPDA